MGADNNVGSREEDKLPVSRLISNVAYIIKFAMEIDRMVLLGVYGAFLFCSVVYAIYSTYFLKYFITMIQNDRFDLSFMIG